MGALNLVSQCLCSAANFSWTLECRRRNQARKTKTSPQCDKKQVAICSSVQREKRPEDQEETPMLDEGLPYVDVDMLSTWHDSARLKPPQGSIDVPILK